ncbi:MAG: radical SAM protein [bacterium]
MTETTDKNLVRLTEIFYSIQGEGRASGRPCVFVRLSRCNLRCTWCDTTYSFTGGEKRSIDDILEQVKSYGCQLVEITGGEPLLQPTVHPLMTQLCDDGYTVMIETSGSLDVSTIDPRVHIIMDLKAPGSAEEGKNLYANVDHLKPTDEVKIVIKDRVDYDWAKAKVAEFDLGKKVAEVVFSPVHGEMDAHTLANWILEDQLPVRLGLQLHKFLSVE